VEKESLVRERNVHKKINYILYTCLKQKIIVCPHEPVLIEKIDCGIFRHAVLIATGEVSPHLNEGCETLHKLYCKPFQIIKTCENVFKIQVCGYI